MNTIKKAYQAPVTSSAYTILPASILLTSGGGGSVVPGQITTGSSNVDGSLQAPVRHTLITR